MHRITTIAALLIIILGGCEKLEQCHCQPIAYTDQLPALPKLVTHFQLKEALFCAASCHKPVLVLFTGHALESPMDEMIGNSTRIRKRINDEYVFLNLYVDHKQIADSCDWVFNENNKELTNLGKINSHLQASRFNSNSIPFWYIVDARDSLIGKPIGYCSKKEFIQFLDNGIDAFNGR